ncbi:choline kinase family protein [Flexivirga caeni]|uniref:LPS biosynthesis choline kinase n=1 Tax=Flexivirga caeni TaxID=2294115 RepID=A0A3M9LUN7_9MICO|nr:choline kinase family protein [Flexivirga caeni]RNI17046.1 LPS biosynthesis choline kinase [Flexivirga caeni]
MTTPMSDEKLAQLFDQIPCLAGRPRVIQELSGGLTNRNVRVTTPAGDYVARCANPGAEKLGIDRQAEHANSVAAHRAGVGAPVIDFRPDLGVLVIGFLDGKTFGIPDFSVPGNLARVAASCRALHRGPRFVNDFNMFARQRQYLETATRAGYRIPSGYGGLAERFHEVGRALAILDEGTVPCNNDLLAGNFVDDGEQVWIIDYEYSGNNDACFELGDIWAESALSLDQLDELVTSYYGRPRTSKVARARLLGAVGQYGWTLWGAIQNVVSPLDFDFWEWTLEHFDVAARELRGADLPRLLTDVATPD